MSHYATIATRFEHKEELIEALEDLYGKGSVEECNPPGILYDYRNKPSDRRANIIVRRQFIGSGSNDLGFEYDHKTMGYKMHISDYDRMWDRKHNKSKIADTLVPTYAAKVIKNRLPKKYSVKSIEKNKIVLRVKG